MATIKVRPWGPEQGDFVIINEDDFDPEFHTLLGDKPAEKAKPARKAKTQASEE